MRRRRSGELACSGAPSGEPGAASSRTARAACAAGQEGAAPPPHTRTATAASAPHAGVPAGIRAVVTVYVSLMTVAMKLY